LKEISMHQVKEYASFSSLIWVRSRKKTGEIIPHRWRWKSYRVWGVGCDAHGNGGKWFANIAPFNKRGFPSQFDAQAAVESHDLEKNPPELLMDDVDTVWEHLNEVIPVDFETLQLTSGLEVGRLSDALARAYELEIIKMSVLRGVGYLRETRRRK
jgi:hypothetical protein